MKTLLKTEGTRTSFIIADLDLTYAEVAQSLYYDKTEAGFVKTFPADTPHLASIFERFSRCAEEMILQAANVHAVPWQEALLALLQRIERQKVNWWLVGSAALAVRGLKIVPHDIDLCILLASSSDLAIIQYNMNSLQKGGYTCLHLIRRLPGLLAYLPAGLSRSIRSMAGIHFPFRSDS